MTEYLIKTLIALSTYVLHAAEYVRTKAIEAQDRAEAAEAKRVSDADRLARQRKDAAKKAAAAAVSNAEASYARAVLEANSRKCKARERKDKLKAL